MTHARDIFDQSLLQEMHAIRTMVMTAVVSPLGDLAFSRDMFLNVPLVAYWLKIARHSEYRVNDNLLSAIRKQRLMD